MQTPTPRTRTYRSCLARTPAPSTSLRLRALRMRIASLSTRMVSSSAESFNMSFARAERGAFHHSGGSHCRRFDAHTCCQSRCSSFAMCARLRRERAANEPPLSQQPRHRPPSLNSSQAGSRRAWLTRHPTRATCTSRGTCRSPAPRPRPRRRRSTSGLCPPTSCGAPSPPL